MKTLSEKAKNMIITKQTQTILLLFTFILLPFKSISQNKEEAFEKAVYILIKAFENNDQQTVNSFINKDFKVVAIFKIGVINRFVFSDSLDLSATDYRNGYRPLHSVNSDHTIQYEQLPEFDCDTERWTKPSGLHCDKGRKDTLFTETVRFFMNYEMKYFKKGDEISDKQFKVFQDIEKNSRRIVLLDDNNDLVFYLSWINKKWYLTIIDRVSSDCSA